jgi:hypothetical protein
LLSANSSCCQAYSGLSPPSNRPCRAHYNLSHTRKGVAFFIVQN